MAFILDLCAWIFLLKFNLILLDSSSIILHFINFPFSNPIINSFEEIVQHDETKSSHIYEYEFMVNSLSFFFAFLIFAILYILNELSRYLH